MTHYRPHSIEMHGHVRNDPYFWMRDRDNPEVLAYLEAENARTDQALAHLEPLRTTLFEEIKGRMKKDDSTSPYRNRDYYYYSRYEADKEYPLHCRKFASLDAPEEVMLDVNLESRGENYFHVGGLNVSAEQDILAYSVDRTGGRLHTIHFKNLRTGEMFPDRLEEVSGAMAWANDNKTLFYAHLDPVTLRSDRIFRHVLGTDPASDELVYEEKDDTFRVTVFKSKSRRHLMIFSNQTLTTEFRLVDANHPEQEPHVFLPRQRGHEYIVDHLADQFYILSNDKAPNFRLFKAPDSERGREAWSELVAHREDVYLENFELFDHYFVTEERSDGLVSLQIFPADGGPSHFLDFGEPAYIAYLGTNIEADTDLLRFGYTSMTTPSSVYHYHMGTREKTLLKRQEILGSFRQEDYRTERLHAVGHDGVSIPISLVYRIDTFVPGQNPLLLHGYGAYGSSGDTVFSNARLSLLDRGFVFAEAHIRGGQELGRQWYDGGRLLNKRNTFLDFIHCARHLRELRYGAPDRLYAIGGSAGGLLMGAVMNIEPELFHGVIAHVPFVDVVTTMLDADLPLTTGEYDEWGHPEDPEYYHYMLSYSPYDNVAPRPYPHLLVTTGINDTQVHYWEPAKWVAKLRANKTSDTLLLLKTDLDVGHGGPSGRFEQIQKTAFDYAFLLYLAGRA